MTSTHLLHRHRILRRRVLTIAAASGRVGHVLLEDMVVATWGLSRKASRGAGEAEISAAGWIERLRPDIVVTEKILPGSRKGDRSKTVIAAITAVADLADVLNIEVARWQGYESKFAEAKALAEDHPKLAHLVPKVGRPWDPEPRTTLCFEALALALCALGDPNLKR